MGPLLPSPAFLSGHSKKEMTPVDALCSQPVRDLAHIKALQRRTEAGDQEAKQESWQLAGATQVKMAIRRRDGETW